MLRAKVEALESATTPARAISSLEHSLMSVLQRVENNNAGRDSVVEHLWTKVIAQERDLTAAVEHLMELCVSLTERLEVQTQQEHELVETVRRGLPRGEGTSGRSRVIGGSMFATENSPADVIDLEEPRHNDGWHNAS